MNAIQFENPKLAKWLKLPASEWGQALNYKGFQTDWQDLVSELQSLSIKAARLAEYIEVRQGTDGTGPKDHADAVKATNKRTVKVRKALGYSYPDRGTYDF